jgi:glycosyltransferase involved in cell wall biosynthesis
MSQPRICLNAIIKNEAQNLPRMLASVCPHITAAVIFDTGSTDGSQKLMRDTFNKCSIPHQIVEGEFKNFEQARNKALFYAQRFHAGFDYILFCDADMELIVDGLLPKLTEECYTLLQKQGSLAYYNARLLRKGSSAKYHGVTHEYVDCVTSKLPTDCWWFKDHATGSNRGDKYERDCRLLKCYLDSHPNDGRSLFYLAQTYRDSGDHAKALEYYKRRVEVGGWDEEVWYSKLSIARCYRALGMEADFIRASLEAYNFRPSRAEPLYDLARYYREKDNQQQVGWLFAQAGSKIEKPKDLLFVEEHPYDYGFLEEKSILGAYNDKTKASGFYAADKLSLMQKVPDVVRETARRNLFWYLQPIKNYAPSFQAWKIPQVNPDSKFTNSNPSVAIVDNQVKAIVRTVSYRIRQDGSYDYNGNSAIRTTNWLCDFDEGVHGWMLEKAVGLQRPTGFPEPVFKDILDVEDMRLFPWGGELWANGCVLEQNQHAWREQFLMRVNQDTGEVTDWRRMDVEPKQNEKNWMPILDTFGSMKWMYRPGWVIDRCGTFIVKNQPTLAVDQFSGGGQCVPFDAGYLAIIHEARPDPTNGKRYYQHRFVWFDKDYRLQKVSKPFVFFDKQIEFAAGLAHDEHFRRFIVSFGVLDREAWLATIYEHEVRVLLWQ